MDTYFQFDEYVEDGVTIEQYQSKESDVLYNINNIRACPINETSDGMIVRAKSPIVMKDKWKAAGFRSATGRPGVETPEERNCKVEVCVCQLTKMICYFN